MPRDPGARRGILNLSIHKRAGGGLCPWPGGAEVAKLHQPSSRETLPPLAEARSPEVLHNSADPRPQPRGLPHPL